MDASFSTQLLTDKLSKLNNSQQSIESLSKWCINHRKKARQVVEIWKKLFNSSLKEQKVCFLYLANDILQNSRRKGSEFVNEFWKVLPGSLKAVYENGEENIKNVVMRLVDIWDQRNVFGSRGRGLKDDILGNTSPPLSESNGKSSNPIKLVKKDAHSIRIKLAVGGMPEKIVTAYQAVLDGHFDEDTALNKCKTAVRALEELEKSVDEAYALGNQQGSQLTNELEEQEKVLKQCIQQLGQVEATRSALVAQLKEALQEQESKLELICNQLQIAQAEAEHAINMMKKPASTTINIGLPVSANITATLVASQVETTLTTKSMQAQQTSSKQPITSYVNSLSSADDEHKKAAAAVAAKLAASTSSAQMLTSVLSSLVAEEAASKNGGQSSGLSISNVLMFPPDKRPKLEKPLSMPDMSSNFFAHVPLQQHQLTTIPLSLSQTSTASNQLTSQSNQPPQSFPMPPPLPPVPPPSVPPYIKTNGVMMGMLPFPFGGGPLPPPPPLPSHLSVGMTRLNAPLQLSPPPSTPPQPPQQQQPAATTGFYPFPSVGFYGQLPTAPLVPRQ